MTDGNLGGTVNNAKNEKREKVNLWSVRPEEM